jgi:hypothetical protein
MRPLLVTLVLVTALGLSGCNDDDDSSGTPSEPASSSSAPASPTQTEPTEPALDACKVLGASDVGPVLDATVTRVVAKGGCRFASEDDPAAASLGISQGELKALGGIDGAKAGIKAVVDGEVEDVPDVGDGAFVVVGTTFGGDTPTGGGAVALGSSLIQITVIPGPDATDEDVRATTVDLLSLIAKKAGR